MATVNFSVPSEVKDAFDKVFAGKNKSAVLTGLMRQAVEERKLRRRRARAIEQLSELRTKIRPVSAKVIRAARIKGRP
jgi:hypothetical protein